MPQRALLPAATALSRWIEGTPEDSVEARILRAEKYRQDCLTPKRLGELLTVALFQAAGEGRPVELAPEECAYLTAEEPRRWEERQLLAATVLQLLQQRGAFDRSGLSPERCAVLDRLVESFDWSVPAS